MKVIKQRTNTRLERASAAEGQCKNDEQAEAAAIQQRHERIAQRRLKMKLLQRETDKQALVALLEKFERVAKRRDRRLKEVEQDARMTLHEKRIKRCVTCLEAKQKRRQDKDIEQNSPMQLRKKRTKERAAKDGATKSQANQERAMAWRVPRSQEKTEKRLRDSRKRARDKLRAFHNLSQSAVGCKDDDDAELMAMITSSLTIA